MVQTRRKFRFRRPEIHALGLLRIVTIILAIKEVGSCQQSIEKPLSPTCDYVELYRKDGWVIPGVEGARPKNRRMRVPNNPTVYMTELEPPSRISNIQTFQCSREHAGRLEINDVEIGIRYLASFDVGGRVFAYSLEYGIDVIENGRSIPVGAVWDIKFYDLDGTGHFTIRRGELVRIIPDLIPDWVKHSGEQPSQIGPDARCVPSATMHDLSPDHPAPNHFGFAK